MGLMDFIKKQFIDVIQWENQAEGLLSYRYPMRDMEIQNGAQLVVRDSQIAIFVNEGKIADIFSVGTYTLTTKTLPVMTNLKNWDKFFDSPFKSDVYFISTKLQSARGWGTYQPITIRDSEFGSISMRAHGVYSYKISDVKAFYVGVVGSVEEYYSESIEGQLTGLILSTMTSEIANAKVPFLDLASNQVKLGKDIKDKLVTEFANYGIAIDNFLIESITLPDELQRALNKKMSMNVVGDLSQYAKFQMAEAIEDSANNPGGSNAGMEMGMGLVMAKQMFEGMNPSDANKDKENVLTTEEIMNKIEKLHGLFSKGILSQDEYELKKKELLARL